MADHPAVLKGVHACLKSGGRLLFQMGGHGNAHAVFEAIQAVAGGDVWRPHLEDFAFPYTFLKPEAYARWLPECGFRLVRADLFPKDMQHQGPEGLKGWLRTTWFPYTDRLPADRRDRFLDEVVAVYLAAHPLDAEGSTHVEMVRLEIEAICC